jgi:peptidoglycan-associated lipoprotein
LVSVIKSFRLVTSTKADKFEEVILNKESIIEHKELDMSLFQEFLVIAAIICSFSGCASVSVDRAVDATIVSAISETQYSEADAIEEGTIYFDYDKYDLSASAILEIRELANAMKSNLSARIRIEGHCDERGTREYNLALGEKRANAVSELLRVNGVASSKLTTVSYGEEKPVAYSSNEAAWGKNRRAEIKVL